VGGLDGHEGVFSIILSVRTGFSGRMAALRRLAVE
jgi:hypothetical protein